MASLNVGAFIAISGCILPQLEGSGGDMHITEEEGSWFGKEMKLILRSTGIDLFLPWVTQLYSQCWICCCIVWINFRGLRMRGSGS